MRNDVTKSLSSTVPLFISPIFHSPDVPRPYIPQFLYIPLFPHEVCPISLTIYVPQSLCSPVPFFHVPLFPSSDIPHKWFAVPMFPKDMPESIDLQNLCSPPQYLVEPFPGPMSTKDVPQSLCYPDPLFLNICIPQNWKTLVGNFGTGGRSSVEHEGGGNIRTREHFWGKQLLGKHFF